MPALITFDSCLANTTYIWQTSGTIIPSAGKSTVYTSISYINQLNSDSWQEGSTGCVHNPLKTSIITMHVHYITRFITVSRIMYTKLGYSNHGDVNVQKCREGHANVSSLVERTAMDHVYGTIMCTKHSM